MTVYIGIDWSQDKHDVCWLNETGAVLAYSEIAHSIQGFRQLETQRQKFGYDLDACMVGIETNHNLLLDFLWQQGYRQIYVVPPSVVKSARPRYRQSGARSDKSDALVVADLLRTDQSRLHIWTPGTALTRQLAAEVGAWIHRTRLLVQLVNRLRAVLDQYYPAAADVFSGLDTRIALAFILQYPTPDQAAALSLQDFEAFAKNQHYTHPKQLAQRHATLHQPQPPALPQTIQTFASEAQRLAGLIVAVLDDRRSTQASVRSLFQQHPDQPIFASLPGAGDLLAPGLLAKFGDDRARFPSHESVQALAGTCPVTQASGKRRVVRFRQACDREFRFLAHAWAVQSISQAPWAKAYWLSVYDRCHSKHQAHRALANRWLAIAWKCWQSGKPYDEAYHMNQRNQRARPRA